MWECGLKYKQMSTQTYHKKVTPLVGVWIEMTSGTVKGTKGRVTPLVGVWIEISHEYVQRVQKSSHSPCGSVD